ncbi:MAG: WcbI family polysaccharide biosynthesis putative acetyltransferase [Hyphomonadaceae bacterium]
MKICVFGNCQAQPLAAMLQRGLPAALVSTLAPNYQMTDADEAEAMACFEQADVIATQLVGDNFPVPWVRSTEIRRRFPHKAVVWPNIYFDGYFPDVQYVYLPGWGKLSSPLEDYHFGLCINAFNEGLSVAQTTVKFDIAHLSQAFPRPFENSILELQSREAACDVSISEFLAPIVAERRCFFTPNHPYRFVVAELAARIARATGTSLRPEDVRDAALELDRIRIPPHPGIRDGFGIRFPAGDHYAGVDIIDVTGQQVLTGAPKAYDLPALVESFFRIYERALR